MASDPTSPSEPGFDLERYSRHVILPEIGIDGQRKLAAASVLCIGLGGLGSPAAFYLAAAGVGRLGLVDADRVDRSNLQRQILHGEDFLDQPKTRSAQHRLRALNPDVQLDLYEEFLTPANAKAIAAPYDLILDGTDNFATRYLSNDLSVLLGKPNVYGSIYRFEGQVSVFAPKLGAPCYRCLFPEPPPPGTVPSCAEAGVLGVLPGIIGSLQALEAIKLILGAGDALLGRLLHFDALKLKFREIRLRPDPSCPVCGENPSIRDLLPDYEIACGVGDSPPITEISVQELRHRLAENSAFLLDVREPFERDICQIEGSHLIPLGELEERVEELPRDREILVYCKVGGRSARAVETLLQLGFDRSINVAGGIRAWAREIDPGMPVY